MALDALEQAHYDRPIGESEWLIHHSDRGGYEGRRFTRDELAGDSRRRSMPEEVSTFRLYLMRAGYLVNFALVGLGAWPALVNHTGPWDPVRGAAFSLYAALSTLSALGIRYPLRMVLLLLFQLFYKVVWLIAVAVPTWPALRGATREMAAGVVLDLIVIPWPYVFEHYVKKGGDRWSSRSRSISPEGVQKPATLTTR